MRSERSVSGCVSRCAWINRGTSRTMRPVNNSRSGRSASLHYQVQIQPDKIRRFGNTQRFARIDPSVSPRHDSGEHVMLRPFLVLETRSKPDRLARRTHPHLPSQSFAIVRSAQWIRWHRNSGRESRLQTVLHLKHQVACQRNPLPDHWALQHSG